MRPPEWFVRAIETLDPLLSVRWGAVMGQWVIERVGHIPAHEVWFLTRRYERLATWLGRGPSDKDYSKNLETFRGVAEELNAAKRGKRVVFFSPQLTNATYEHLCASDIQRYGGYSRFADELEKNEKAEAERRERVRREQWLDYHGEVHGILNHIWNKKATQLAHGERDLNKLLHGTARNTAIIDFDPNVVE